MKILRRLLLLVIFPFGIGFILSVPVRADFTLSQLQFENALHDRLYSIIAKVDPNAIVEVRSKLKRVESTLPFLGGSTDVIPGDGSNDLRSESIQSVDVKVITHLNPFPDWIKKEVKESATFGGLRVRISYVKPDGDIINFQEEMIKYIQDYLSAFKNTRLTLWGLVITLAVTMLGLMATIMFASRRFEKSMIQTISEKLIPTLTAMSFGGGPSTSRREKSESGDGAAGATSVARGVTPSATETDDIRSLPLASLKALFTDCYWTEQDGYANHLWGRLSISQRESVLNSGFIDSQYFSFVRRFAPQDLGYHTDVWYLNPYENFSRVDQKELLNWARKNSQYSSMISPMRIDFMDFSLREKLDFVQKQKKQQIEREKAAQIKIDKVSVVRELPQQLRITKISDADELYIFENPKSVPAAVRPQIQSLVWLAIAPEDYRKKVLSEVDARQLAEGWVGPAPVLKKLREVIAEKKLEMLDHFLTASEPTRDSDSYRYLVQAGIAAPEAMVEETGKAA